MSKPKPEPIVTAEERKKKPISWRRSYRKDGEGKWIRTA